MALVDRNSEAGYRTLVGYSLLATAIAFLAPGLPILIGMGVRLGVLLDAMLLLEAVAIVAWATLFWRGIRAHGKRALWLLFEVPFAFAFPIFFASCMTGLLICSY